MKPWRERIAEARERGAFTEEDRHAWMDPKTCLVGEQRARLGIDCSLQMGFLTRDIQLEAINAIDQNDVDGLERLLDVIEDRAIQIKRGEVPGGSSRFRGVYWNATLEKWVAQIRDGKLIYLGLFEREVAAAAAYDAAARERFGEYANPNLP